MKKCVNCGKEIADGSLYCEYCGEKQLVEYETANTEDGVNNTTCTKQKQKKTLIIGLSLLGAVIIITGIITLMVILFSSCNDTSSDTMDTNIVEDVDNSVNGKGYYYYDNTLDVVIEKYRQIAEDTDSSSLVNVIDDITIDAFSTSDVMFLDSEIVTEYYYTYHNSHTAISLYVNEDGSIPAFTYLYTSAVTNGSNYSQEAQINQLINKPAKWLYALSDDLTYDEALDIYKILFTQHMDAISQAKAGGSTEISHYYKGYTIAVSGSDSTEAITVVKSDSDFASSNGISAGEKSIIQPIGASNSQTQNDNIVLENVVIESDNELGYVFNMTPQEMCDYFNSANRALDIDETYNIDSSLLEKSAESKILFGTEHLWYHYGNNTLYVDFYMAAEVDSGKVDDIQLNYEFSGDDQNQLIKAKEKRWYALIKMLNPEFEYSEVQELVSKIYSSKDATSGGATCMYYNNVAYFVYEEETVGVLTARPMTEEYYNSKMVVSSDKSENRIAFDGFSLEVPDSWTYSEEGSDVYFYEKYNNENGWDGLLITIFALTEKPSAEDMEFFRYTLLGEGNGYYYVSVEPSGMCYNYSDTTAADKYQEARGEINSTMSTFEID